VELANQGQTRGARLQEQCPVERTGALRKMGRFDPSLVREFKLFIIRLLSQNSCEMGNAQNLHGMRQIAPRGFWQPGGRISRRQKTSRPGFYDELNSAGIRVTILRPAGVVVRT
jgi:hypothetical protein